MRTRWTSVLLVAIATLVATARPSHADTIRYVLTAGSQITHFCNTCDEAATEPKTLHGTFDLTVMPVPAEHAVEAVTAVDWEGDALQITGTGFVQRLGTDRLAMVVDARVNGESALLTSGRRQTSSPGELRIHLATPRGSDNGYRLTVVAVPMMTDAPDADRDGVPDTLDNCPAVASSNQDDADGDRVGDSCDLCPATALGNPVLDDGCAPSQRCDCDGPAPDEEWESPRAYVQCVAITLKRMRQQRKLSRDAVRQIMQDAVRSGCGRRVLALN